MGWGREEGLCQRDRRWGEDGRVWCVWASRDTSQDPLEAPVAPLSQPSWGARHLLLPGYSAPATGVEGASSMHICRREKAQGLHLRRGGPWGPQVTLIYASARRPCRRERGVSSFPKKALFKEGPLSLSTRDLLTACGAHGPEPGQTASSHSEFSGRHHHVAGSSLSWFSNLMIHLVTLLREAQSRLARSGEPRSCGSTWPGGPGRRHPYPGRCPHRAAQGSAWSQVPRLPERGSWELRMLRLRAQGVLSQQAFSRSPHPNSPFLATKGAWLQRPPHSPIRRPRSRGGCEPFSPPFRGCFGHPDPGVSGGARTPPTNARGSNLVSHP